MSNDKSDISSELEKILLEGKLEKFEICRNCKYYDDGTGEKTTAKSGDCYNLHSPRFSPEWDFSCKEFYLRT